MAPRGVELQHDLSPAAWVAGRLDAWRGGWATAGSFVPDVYPAYARIFHPARDTRTGRAMSWAEVADLTGRTAHPLMQFARIAGDEVRDWLEEPQEGSLPRGLLEDLVGVVRRFTSTQDPCWFCIWEGYGWLHGGGLLWGSLDDAAERSDHVAPALHEIDPIIDVGDAPTVKVPGRGYYLLRGGLSGSAAFMDADAFAPRQSPNMMWPDDRSWFVSTEIDLNSTYVGASRACVDAILSDAHLEAAEADVRDPIHIAGDTINPA